MQFRAQANKPAQANCMSILTYQSNPMEARQDDKRAVAREVQRRG